jgi:hypothetical protein
MGISSGSSAGQRAGKAPDERHRVGIQSNRRLSVPCRDVPSAGAPSILGNPEGDDEPVTSRSGMATDAGLERILTVIHGLQEERSVRRLPRAAQLSPIPGLAPIDLQSAVPTRVVDLNNFDKLMPITTLQRPGRVFSGKTAFLFAGAIGAAWAGYFVLASWRPATDFVERPSRASSEPRLVPLSALAQAVANEAAPEPQLTTLSEDKPPENEIEASLPRTLSPAEYKVTTAERNAILESISVQEASPKSGADAALGGQDTKPLIDTERRVSPASVQVSTCFPSASAVRQEYPEAWPSWTLRAPGHEGTKCWHAATRATVHDHRDIIGKVSSPGETK